MKRILSISLLLGTLTLFSHLLAGCDFLGDLTRQDDENANDGIMLFPVRIDGEWGYVNENGRIRIEPGFNSAHRFSEGLARIREGRVGYIGPDGEYVIEPRFDEGLAFSEGLAAVRVDGRWGFINKSGAFAINPQFHNAHSFKEGRAFVLTPGFDWQYVDHSGQIVRTVDTPRLTDFEVESNDFSNGLALVYDFDTEQYGYMDKDGNMAIEFQYTEARAFYEGLAAIKISDSWGFIDTKGNTAISPRYIEAGNFGDGMVPVRQNTNTWGYANKSGQMVIEPQFEDVGPFSEERAPVLIDGLWGYIDTNGTQIGRADYDEVFPFEKGIAMVILEILDPDDENNRLTNYGYVGHDGRLVWYPTR